MSKNQYVCEVCGFNIIDYYPNQCPFCGASNKNFITAEECSERYHIKRKKITPNISQLTSSPQFGLEHAAYKIKLDKHIVWIDCPSTFQKEVEKMEILLFTHHHFLAAANLYQKHFNSELWIHKMDAYNSISEHYDFNKTFQENFTYESIKAHHINGHTAGFTIYVFQNALFICDYTFLNSNGGLNFNPYGPQGRTLEGAQKMKEILSRNSIAHVCGYNFTMKYDDWFREFTKLI